MCKVQMLRALVKQRLTAAAEEIFGLFERTIAEYEEELSRSKEENERQRKLLDAVFNPQLRLHRADVQQLLVVKEEVPPSSVDQEDPDPPHIKEDQEDPEPPHIKEDQEEPEPPHIKEEQEDPEPPYIKEEQEELWSSQEGEQLQGLEEADITKFPFTPVPVKSEDDEEKPQSSQLHQRLTEQMETEAGGDTDDSGDWEDISGPPLGLVPLSHPGHHAGEKPFGCSECDKRFGFKNTLKRHMRTHTGEKPFCCSLCDERFLRMDNLKRHMIGHTGEKPFSCSVCGKTFNESGHLNRHMRNHTGEKPFSCPVCGKRFPRKDNFVQHMSKHTGEKPFSCSVCRRSFSWRTQLKNHQCDGNHSSEQQTQTEENAEPSAAGFTQQENDPSFFLFPPDALSPV